VNQNDWYNNSALLHNLEGVLRAHVQHEESLEKARWIYRKKGDIKGSNPTCQGSEGTMVTTEDGQEVHKGTTRSIRYTAGKYLSEVMSEILCSI